MKKPEYANAIDPDYVAVAGEVKKYLSENKSREFEKRYFGIKMIVALALYGSGFVLLFTGANNIFLGYLILALASYFSAFNLAHDLSHGSVFGSKKRNFLMYYLIMTLIGVSGYFWKKRHLESHHPHPNIDGYDLDIEVSKYLRFSEQQKLLGIHRFQFLYAPFIYLFYSLVWFLIKDFISIREEKAKLMLLIRILSLKLFYLTVFLFLPIYHYDTSLMISIIFAFLLHHFLLSWLVIFTFLISHYTMPVLLTGQKEIERSWFRHQVAVSVDFHSKNKWANCVFGGFNCHVAHHLFPQVNSCYYPAITLIIKKRLESQGISYNQLSFARGIVSHLKYLKRMGKGVY